MKNFARIMTRAFRPWSAPILAIVAVVGLVMSCSSANAQSGAGSIQGTVTDATGAVIPAASIHVVNQATNVATDTKSNNVGFYQVPALFTGTYSVTVTAPNMKTYKTSIQLLVAQSAIINPVMTAGAVTQQVEVAANAVQLTTSDNGTITSTLENARINQLPMNGRVLSTLVSMTTPGYEGSSAGGTRLERPLRRGHGVCGRRRCPGEPRIRRHQHVQHPDSRSGLGPGSPRGTDNGGAQYATPGTGVITTKSGTNRMHGALFETARNNAFGIAKSRRIPPTSLPPPTSATNLACPAAVRSFCPIFTTARTRASGSSPTSDTRCASGSTARFTGPDAGMRNGDFSDLNSTASHPQSVRSGDHAQRSKLQRHRRGQSLLPYAISEQRDPVRAAYLLRAKILNDIAPLPNLTSINPFEASNLLGAERQLHRDSHLTFRLDHVFNENNRAYLRYTSNINSNVGLRNYPGNEPGSLAADGLPHSLPAVPTTRPRPSPAAIGYHARLFAHVSFLKPS